jgi:hypothetical protein
MTDKSIKLFHNQLYGVDETNLYFRELGSDSEQNYKKNLKTQDDSWIYNHKQITYVRNSCGHRCKEIHELNEDFVLFIGCSITEGVSLSLEDTYPYVLSKMLNTDYYNLGIGGSGIDLLSFNLVSWFNHIKKRPKFIIIQWPEIYRRFQKENNEIALLGPWIKNKEYELELSGNSLEHYYFLLKDIIQLYTNQLNIPVIDFNISDIDYKDYGRDLKHPGILSHQYISTFLHNKIKSF